MYVPPGRVDYDALLHAKTFDGCKKFSSYAGLALPTELWHRQLFCDCAACIAGSMDPSQVPEQCGNADWLAPAHTVGMQPLSAASHRVTRPETEAAVDEFTAEIPAKCHVGVICGLDEAGLRFWVAKTVGRLRIVAEGRAFVHAAIRFDVGEKYFVVNYYTPEKKDKKKPLSPENIVPNSFVRSQEKGYVHNHLIMRHYGFDMPRHKNSRDNVAYGIPDHDDTILKSMIVDQNN